MCDKIQITPLFIYFPSNFNKTVIGLCLNNNDFYRLNSITSDLYSCQKFVKNFIRNLSLIPFAISYCHLFCVLRECFFDILIFQSTNGLLGVFICYFVYVLHMFIYLPSYSMQIRVSSYESFDLYSSVYVLLKLNN